ERNHTSDLAGLGYRSKVASGWLRSDQPIETVEFYDLRGRLLSLSSRAVNNGLAFDLTVLPAGLYWIKVNEGTPVKLIVE
ncbi:MAG: T9SS type A sorting domain-containing protein, partial [Bacteroidota bacterium]